MRWLLCIIQRILSASVTAIDWTYAFGFENFPAALFLPSRVARRSDFNDSRAHPVTVTFSTTAAIPLLQLQR
jgi:hypothetical protein